MSQERAFAQLVQLHLNVPRRSRVRLESERRRNGSFRSKSSSTRDEPSELLRLTSTNEARAEIRRNQSFCASSLCSFAESRLSRRQREGSRLQDPRALDVIGNAGDAALGNSDANRGERNCALRVVPQNNDDGFSVRLPERHAPGDNRALVFDKI